MRRGVESRSMNEPQPRPTLSVVIPVCNERDNVGPLAREIHAALKNRGPFEILFVDDGSSDRSPEILAELAAKEDAIKVIRFRRNFGQTAAVSAGIEHASGDVIVVLDGGRGGDNIAAICGFNPQPDLPGALQYPASFAHPVDQYQYRFGSLESGTPYQRGSDAVGFGRGE